MHHTSVLKAVQKVLCAIVLRAGRGWGAPWPCSWFVHIHLPCCEAAERFL